MTNRAINNVPRIRVMKTYEVLYEFLLVVANRRPFEHPVQSGRSAIAVSMSFIVEPTSAICAATSFSGCCISAARCSDIFIEEIAHQHLPCRIAGAVLGRPTIMSYNRSSPNMWRKPEYIRARLAISMVSCAVEIVERDHYGIIQGLRRSPRRGPCGIRKFSCRTSRGRVQDG